MGSKSQSIVLANVELDGLNMLAISQIVACRSSCSVESWSVAGRGSSATKQPQSHPERPWHRYCQLKGPCHRLPSWGSTLTQVAHVAEARRVVTAKHRCTALKDRMFTHLSRMFYISETLLIPAWSAILYTSSPTLNPYLFIFKSWSSSTFDERTPSF